MIVQEHLKEIDNMELNEILGKKLEVLEMCTDGIISNHDGTLALRWAIDDVLELIDEAQCRLEALE